MVFPKNNLPVQSQPWTRDVEKRVENLESTFRSAEVNNATRDSQALSQIRRLDAAVTDVAQAAADATAAAAAAQAAANTANTSINGLISLGTDGSSYSVHGGNITANTITANEINSSYVYAGTLSAGQITSGSLSADFISGGTIDASNIGAVNITGASISGGSISSTGANGTVTVSNGSVGFSGGGKTGSINPTATYGLGLTSSDRVYVSAPNGIEGALASFADVQGAYLTAQTSFLGTYNTTIANNTTASFAGNVFINTSGNMFRSTSTSSREAKQNITPYEFDTDAFIAINPVTFNYKANAVSDPTEAEITQLGFIVEDFENIGLGEYLAIPANEIDQYKGLRYDKLYMFLHKVVQEQQAKIAELEARIATLEGKVE